MTKNFIQHAPICVGHASATVFQLGLGTVEVSRHAEREPRELRCGVKAAGVLALARPALADEQLGDAADIGGRGVRGVGQVGVGGTGGGVAAQDFQHVQGARGQVAGRAHASVSTSRFR